MIHCAPQLVDALSNDLETVSEDLFAAGLISAGTRNHILHKEQHDHEKASRLVSNITDRVNSSPSDFDKLVSILKEQGPWTDHILSHLIATYTENKFDIKLTKLV